METSQVSPSPSGNDRWAFVPNPAERLGRRSGPGRRQRRWLNRRRVLGSGRFEAHEIDCQMPAAGGGHRAETATWSRLGHGATPIHGSWLNRVEIYFSIIQRKAVSPHDFTDTDEIVARLSAFESHYNQTARSFQWRFTPADLTDYLT